LRSRRHDSGAVSECSRRSPSARSFAPLRSSVPCGVAPAPSALPRRRGSQRNAR
jgi:hypothetical protein